MSLQEGDFPAPLLRQTQYPRHPRSRAGGGRGHHRRGWYPISLLHGTTLLRAELNLYRYKTICYVHTV